jgi:DNA-directed RNA polymerase specialized sigma24 family protein
MANEGRTNEVSVTAYYSDPRSIRWTTEYLKKLLIERHGIRAALENPGGSIVAGGVAQAADADQLPAYSSVVGNDAHLDLLEAEREVNTLDVQDRIELLAWCDGLSPKQAAQWANLKGGRVRSYVPNAARRRLQRSVKTVAERANEHEDPE